MDLHVNNITRSCFYQLRQLRSIRRSLSTDAAKTLVHSLISSRVDYCNSIFYGATDIVVRRLQSVLNAAARLISNRRKFDHITPVLRDQLHWLPIPGHPSAYRFQDRSLCLQRPSWSWSDIPQPHLQSGPRGRCQGSSAICYSMRPDCASNQDSSLWAQKLPCIGTGRLELTAPGHSNSGTVAGTFQI